MKDRSALIWFSCFCCASENTNSTPRLAASDLMESVFAVRHPLSAPICEKPTTTFFLPPEPCAVSPSELFCLHEDKNPQLSASAKNKKLWGRILNISRGFFIGYLVKTLKHFFFAAQSKTESRRAMSVLRA